MVAQKQYTELKTRCRDVEGQESKLHEAMLVIYVRRSS